MVSRRSIYIQTVTVERAKWIDKLRINMSDVIALAHRLDVELYGDDNFSNTIAYTELTTQIVRLMAQVRLQLNPEGKIDSNILSLMQAIQNYVGDQDYKNLERVMVRHIQWLLKEEWEKVKYEAMGPLGRRWADYKRWRRRRAYAKYCDNGGSVAEWA